MAGRERAVPGMDRAAAVVCKLHFREPLRLDAERLAALYLTLGEARARRAVAGALHELAALAAGASARALGGPETDPRAAIRRAGEIAEALGLVGVARAACDVVEAEEAGDAPAAAATRARLARLGLEAARSVSRIQDLSG